MLRYFNFVNYCNFGEFAFNFCALNSVKMGKDILENELRKMIMRSIGVDLLREDK